MTDEQLASFIRLGGNDELIPLLWGRVRKLMHLLSDRYFEGYKDKLTACGVTSEDIRQSAYMAFVQAIKSFDESKGFKFISYLNYPLKNEIRRIITKDSLNEPVSNDNGDLTERIELIADEAAFGFVERVDWKSLCAAVRAAVAKLSPEYQAHIRKRFYENRTFKEIAEERGISIQAVQQYEKNLLGKLRANEDFIKINDKRYSLPVSVQNARYRNTYSFYKRTGMTAFECEIIASADRIEEYRRIVQRSGEETQRLIKQLGIVLPKK